MIPGLLFYIEKKSRNSTVYSYYETVDSGMKMAVKLIKIMRLLLILTFAIFYVAAIVVYSLEYYCKYLSTLMFSFIVMCSVFIGIIVFMILLYLYNAYHKRIQSQELKYKYFQWFSFNKKKMEISSFFFKIKLFGIFFFFFLGNFEIFKFFLM